MPSNDAGNLVGLIRVDAACPSGRAIDDGQVDFDDATLGQTLARLAGKSGGSRKVCHVSGGERLFEWPESRFAAPLWVTADVERLAAELELATATATRQQIVANRLASR